VGGQAVVEAEMRCGRLKLGVEAERLLEAEKVLEGKRVWEA